MYSICDKPLNNGFLLIELMLALTILSFITGTSIYWYGQIVNNYKIYTYRTKALMLASSSMEYIKSCNLNNSLYDKQHNIKNELNYIVKTLNYGHQFKVTYEIIKHDVYNAEVNYEGNVIDNSNIIFNILTITVYYNIKNSINDTNYSISLATIINT